jgi:hypothetical protein
MKHEITGREKDWLMSRPVEKEIAIVNRFGLHARAPALQSRQ